MVQVVLLSDILPTAWHACELGEVHAGDVVAIWGAGPVGILAAHCAQHRGAKRVILVCGGSGGGLAHLAYICALDGFL